MAEALERVGDRKGSDRGPGTLYIMWINADTVNSVIWGF
jgi:hypothetical protein